MAQRGTVVFLDPSDEQMCLIAARHDERAMAVVLETDSARPVDGVAVITDRELLSRPRLDGERWHCCSERSLYFVRKHRDVAATLPFPRRCLDMLTKLESRNALHAAGIPVVPRADGEPRFPFVAKPNLGFATRLVRRISTAGEWNAYRAAYPAMLERSRIAEYRRRYFADADQAQLEAIVREADLSASTFVTWLLVVDHGEVVARFGAVAEERLPNDLSDFTWGRFAAPVPEPFAASPGIAATLATIARTFCSGSGIFEVEMLADRTTGEHWVLELSPRISGGNIPWLLRFAHGVDLERAAIDLALGRPVDVTPRRSVRHVLQRQSASAATPADALDSRRVSFDGLAYIDVVLRDDALAMSSIFNDLRTAAHSV